MYFYLIIAISIVLDQATKIAVRLNLEIGERAEALGFIPLARFENPGTSGNLFHGYARWLAILVVALVVFGLYLRSRGKFRRPIAQTGLALMIGGALGNTIDRLLYNQVTDFLHFSMQATMNFADISVYAGTILLLASQFTGDSRRGKRESSG